MLCLRVLRSITYTGVVLAAVPCWAEEPAKPADATSEPQAPHVVRIAFTRAAAEKLNALRVRRLVELQLGNDLEVDPEPSGPLDEIAIRVFIELDETTVRVQAHAPGRRIESRPVAVEGVAWEVATRFVAITASELVKSLAIPPRKPKPTTPSPSERALVEAEKPRLEVSSSLEFAYWASEESVALGSRVRASFHERLVSGSLSLAAFGSPSGASAYETELAVLHQFWVSPELRITPGLGLGLLLMPETPQKQDLTLGLRAHALGQLDLQLDPKTWLRFGVEPGFTVEPVSGAVGAWLGGSASVSFEDALWISRGSPAQPPS